MKLNIIAALLFFSLNISSYAFDSDDEEAFLFPNNNKNEQPKKRRYSSDEHAPPKKLKLDSVEEIKEILYSFSFNNVDDLNKIVNIENFFDIAKILLLDHDYNEQIANILCLVIKSNAMAADLRTKAAFILAKNTGSSFLDNIPFKAKGLQACLSVLRLQEKWLIDFFESNPYQDEDYKTLLSFAEDSYIKGVCTLNPNNALNWSNCDYRKILHALALIGSENYEYIIQHIQKNFSNEWSGDSYFNFIQKSFAMIEFGVFYWPLHLRYDITQELYLGHSEKINDLIHFIKILAEPFWTPQHYIKIINTFTSMTIKQSQLIANATKKIARVFWTPDHYVAAIKAFNNIHFEEIINNVSFITDDTNCFNTLIDFVNILSIDYWTPNHYKEVINAFEAIIFTSHPKYIVDAIIHLRSKVMHFTPNQLSDVIRALDKVGEKYAKKLIDAILSVALDDWTSTHFTETIKAFSSLHAQKHLSHIEQTAIAVKAFAAYGRSPAFYASLINEFIDLKEEHIPTIINAVQKLFLPIWTELHYPKVIAAFCDINTNIEQNNKIINIVQKLSTNTLNDKDIFCLSMIGFNCFNIDQPFSFDKMESLYNFDALISNDSALWTPELYYHIIKELGNIILKCSSEEFDMIVDAIQKLSLNDRTPEHYQKIVNELERIVYYCKNTILDKNIYSLNTMVDNYVYILQNIELKNETLTYYYNFINFTEVNDCKILVDALKQYDLTSWNQQYFFNIFHYMKSKNIDSEKYADIVKLIHFFSKQEGFNEENIELLIDIGNFIDPIKRSTLIDFSIDFFQTKYINGSPSCNHMIFVFLFLIQQTDEIDCQKISTLTYVNNNFLCSVFNFLCHVPEKYRIDLINYYTHNIDDNSIDCCLVFINYLKSIPQDDCRSILTYFIEFTKDEHMIKSVVDNLINKNINIAEYLIFFIIEKSTLERLKLYALKQFFCHPKMKEKKCNKSNQYLFDIIQNLSKEQYIDIIEWLTEDDNLFNENKYLLKDLFQKASYNNSKIKLIKLRGYILFGEIFREEYDQLIKSDSFMNLLENNLDDLVDDYSENNTRIQELLILYAKTDIAEDDEPNPLSTYGNLLLKLKENYQHKPSKICFKLNEDQDKMLHFIIDKKALSYLFLNQEALASLEDVDFILRDNPDDTLKNISNSDDFKNYFTAPFSEESMMLQAMIKKFKTMGEEGLKKLAYLMHDMDQCFQGKNQAIWDHYLIESKPLYMAELKNITTWLLRLQTIKNPYITDADLQSCYRMSRKQLATIIFDMLKTDHICRRHFTDINTDDAQRLKALLGVIVEFEGESKDRSVLEKTLKQALDILIKLSNPEEFYKNLDNLCTTHEIYLPANKFGDQLSAASIETLIQHLNEKDVEGRDDLLKAQDKLRLFVNNQDFLNLLGDFKNETGQKLRMLINGYIENNWSVGLLNLMELADSNNLNEAIEETFKNTKIDKDINLTWLSLEKILLRELISVKRQNINAIAENLAGKSYAEIPHDIKYLEGLIGGIIGLRDPQKTPHFDAYGGEVSFPIISTSLQATLDLFHEQFTPDLIIDHLALMINEHKLSIIDPKTGMNIIGQILGLAAKEQLTSKGITEDTCDLDLLLLDDQKKKDAMSLSLALLLEKLGILKETNDENDNIINNNDMITD